MHGIKANVIQHPVRNEHNLLSNPKIEQTKPPANTNSNEKTPGTRPCPCGKEDNLVLHTFGEKTCLPGEDIRMISHSELTPYALTMTNSHNAAQSRI
jgi:hypothetical protein